MLLSKRLLMMCRAWSLVIAGGAALLLFVALFSLLGSPQPPVTPRPCGEWLQAHYPSLPVSKVERVLRNSSGSSGGAQSLPFYDVIVVVPSIASEAGRARRGQVRNAHAVSAGLVPWARVKLLFVMTLNADSGEAKGGDILFVPGCLDDDNGRRVTNGSATSCKVLAALSHVSKAYGFHFFVRSGDDAHFRVDQFLLRVAPQHVGEAVRSPAQRNFAMGHWYAASKNNPSNNVEELAQREEYGTWSFPRYPSGMGFVLSGSLARALAHLHDTLGLVDGYPEDGMVGMWLAGFSPQAVGRIESPCFYNTRAEVEALKECKDEAILVHYMLPKHWGAINEQGRLPFCPF